MAAIETPDPQPVRFKLKEPWPDFLTFYATAPPAPAGSCRRNTSRRSATTGFKKAPIGAGPYKFVSFTPGVELVFEAFDAVLAQDPERQAPGVQGDPRRGDAAGGAEARRGRHRLFDPRRTRRGAAQHARADPEAGRTRRRRSGSISPTSGIRNRLGTTSGCGRAASLAIDRKGINEALTLGYSKITGNSIIPDSFRFLSGSRPAPVYDPAKAKKLLAEAGYPNGFDAGEYYCDSSYANVGEAVLNNLGEVGIRAKLRPIERAAFLRAAAKRSSRTSSRAAAAPSATPRPGSTAFIVKGGAYVYGSYPDIDELFQQQAVELDHEQARGDPGQDAAARPRADDRRADLAAGLHQRRRAAGRRIRVRADPGLRLYRRPTRTSRSRATLSQAVTASALRTGR